MKRGQLYVFTGPSGTGKGSLLKRLRGKDRLLAYSVSATTRSPRPGERDGVDYYFLSEASFRQKVEAGAFLEYAHYVNHWYGTLEKAVEDQLKRGIDVALEIEVQGALQVRAKRPEAILIFIVPPSREELRKRLEQRGTESPEVVEARLAQAEKELEHASQFDYVVVNDDLERAAEELRGIVQRTASGGKEIK